MQVVGDAGSGDGADVDAEIEALGFDDFAEEGLGEESQPPKLENFGWLEFFESGDFPVGTGHEVAAGVRVFVENEEGGIGPGDNKVQFFFLGGSGGGGEEKIWLIAVFGMVILDAPRAPEGLNFSFWKTHWERDLRWKNLGDGEGRGTERGRWGNLGLEMRFILRRLLVWV
jgi:hypothetical protein